MRNQLTAQFRKPSNAVLLLVLWLFAQGSVLAHDLLDSHSFDQACEWQCESNKHDDDFTVTNIDNSWSDNFIDQTTFQRAQITTSTTHGLPFLRGPPRI